MCFGNNNDSYLWIILLILLIGCCGSNGACGCGSSCFFVYEVVGHSSCWGSGSQWRTGDHHRSGPAKQVLLSRPATLFELLW